MADSITHAQQSEMRTEKVSSPIPWGKIVIYTVLSIGTVLAVLPFLWMISWSFMSNAEVITGQAIPREMHPENYSDAWRIANFSRFMWNSVRITGISVAGLLLFCIPAAYAFARMRFFGRNVLFAVMVATLMIPDIVTLIPNFLTVVWLGRLSEEFIGLPWMNNWPALTIPFMASAFTIFLLRQFFAQIPEDLWDAARIDGASHVQYMLRVVIPLSRAPVMTVVTFAFIGSWNSLLWPLLVVTDDTWRPVAYGLTKFVQTDAGSALNQQMAASVIMVLPILVLYFFTQRQFTEGIWAGSLKG